MARANAQTEATRAYGLGKRASTREEHEAARTAHVTAAEALLAAGKPIRARTHLERARNHRDVRDALDRRAGGAR